MALLVVVAPTSNVFSLAYLLQLMGGDCGHYVSFVQLDCCGASVFIYSKWVTKASISHYSVRAPAINITQLLYPFDFVDHVI